MSLTEILRRPHVAAQFSRFIRVPSAVAAAAAQQALVVPVRAHQSYALVGTAFDYCLRFCLAAANPGRFVDQEWIAEISVRMLEQERELPAGVSVDLAVSLR